MHDHARCNTLALPTHRRPASFIGRGAPIVKLGAPAVDISYMAIPADVHRRKPALIVPLLTVFVLFTFGAIVAMLVRIDNSNAQFRAEVEKGLLISDMGAAIQDESQIISSWMAMSMDSEGTAGETPRQNSTLDTLLTQPRQTIRSRSQ